mmetsp:Transcript_24332/g.36426  ORF Transcript_24332/g.36426 Transcript_24332/m.36426 type:complete len:153 (-) Transcript_24332:116-574(-)
MGYGPVISNSPAEAEASYAHSLVHRLEGPHVGEFGMVGWSNANFWSRAASSRDRGYELPLNDIRREVHTLAKLHGEDALAWFDDHMGSTCTDGAIWEPRALHQLCAEVVAGRNAHLKQFAQSAAEKEVQVLATHCLERAGFDVQSSVCVNES